MTPDDRQMISGLFDRMRQQGPVEKDRDAEALIRDSVRQMPDAPYMMVQTVLVQEMALQQSEQRIQELEDRVRSLETPTGRQGSGSFLGGLFGGGASRPTTAASVPSAGRQSAGFSNAPRAAGSPWGNAPQGANGPQGGMPMQQGGMMAPQQSGGGGFMRSAMTTAAGVAGGMLAANAISNMMKGDTAQASAAPKTASSDGNDPAGSYDSGSSNQNDGNDPAGSYDAAPDDQGGYDDGANDGGGWDE